MIQQVTFFEWPSCAGKSTAVDTLLWKYPNIFHINKDKVKWLISDYSSKNEIHRDTLKQMLLWMAKIAIDNWLSVFLEWQKQIVSEILNYTKNKNLNIGYVNLEAPLVVLENRFQDRLIECENKWIKISNTSVEWLRRRYDIYQAEKIEKWITLDTDLLTKEEVVNEIEKYLWIK